MQNKLCEECIHNEDCWILNPRECGECMSVGDYIDHQYEEYCDAYYTYLYSFENC